VPFDSDGFGKSGLTAQNLGKGSRSLATS